MVSANGCTNCPLCPIKLFGLTENLYGGFSLSVKSAMYAADVCTMLVWFETPAKKSLIYGELAMHCMAEFM